MIKHLRAPTIKRIKCDGDGCSAKMPKPKDGKILSFTCYRCRRKVARKPKQEAYAAAHASPAQPTESQPTT